MSGERRRRRAFFLLFFCFFLFCRRRRSQGRAQVRHLQATVTCGQQDRGSGGTGFGGGQTGGGCLYFPCGGLWLLWSLCHTTISHSSNSNAEGGDGRQREVTVGIRVREKERLAKGGGRKQWERQESLRFICLKKHPRGGEVPGSQRADPRRRRRRDGRREVSPRRGGGGDLAELLVDA